MPSYTEADVLQTSAGVAKSVTDIGTGGTGSGNLGSFPPLGNFPVTNVYVNPQGKLVVEWNDAGGGGMLPSVPPAGSYKVTNLYVNNAGKVVVEFDDTPA